MNPENESGGIYAAIGVVIASLTTFFGARLGMRDRHKRETTEAEVSARQNLLTGWERIAEDRRRELDGLREQLVRRDATIEELRSVIGELRGTMLSLQADFRDKQNINKRLIDEVVELSDANKRLKERLGHNK